MIRSTIFKAVCSFFPASLHPYLKEVVARKKYLQEKIHNFLLNREEHKRGKWYLKSYPYSLVLDPTNICNLKCPLCPTWQDLVSRPKGRMNLMTFKSLLNEIGPYLFTANLCNWGEPLLNPDLPEMIEYAKTFNMIIGLSTNLNYLPVEKAKYLAESGIDIIVISLDGASGESYSKYRVGGDFDIVIRNVKTLLSLKKSNRPFPLLIWQFLVNRYNENEIDAARSMAEKLGLQFFASPIRTHMGKELLYPLYERVKAVKEWLPKNPVYNRYAYEITTGTKTRQKTCKWLWNTAVANWDGSLSPCCGVFEKSWDFTAYTYRAGVGKSFHHAWNSERYQLARKMIHTYEKNPRDLKPLLQETEQQQLICTKCIRYGFLEE